MVVGVAWSKNGNPVAIAHTNSLGIVNHDGRARRLHPRNFFNAAIGNRGPNAIAERLEARERFFHIGFVGVSDCVEDGSCFCCVGRIKWFKRCVVEIKKIGPLAEHGRGQNIGVAGFDEPMSATEMVGMRMRDVDGVHSR